jgi:hypothetical protein
LQTERRGKTVLPEEQLLWAILNQAIKDYLYEGCDEYLSAEFYIFHSTDNDFPSFTFICDYFSIDNEKLKDSIQERRKIFDQLGYYKDKKTTKTLIKNHLGLKEREKLNGAYLEEQKAKVKCQANGKQDGDSEDFAEYLAEEEWEEQVGDDS